MTRDSHVLHLNREGTTSTNSCGGSKDLFPWACFIVSRKSDLHLGKSVTRGVNVSRGIYKVPFPPLFPVTRVEWYSAKGCLEYTLFAALRSRLKLFLAT